jgi:hypothetical protein
MAAPRVRRTGEHGEIPARHRPLPGDGTFETALEARRDPLRRQGSVQYRVVPRYFAPLHGLRYIDYFQDVDVRLQPSSPGSDREHPGTTAARRSGCIPLRHVILPSGQGEGSRIWPASCPAVIARDGMYIQVARPDTGSARTGGGYIELARIRRDLGRKVGGSRCRQGWPARART